MIFLPGELKTVVDVRCFGRVNRTQISTSWRVKSLALPAVRLNELTIVQRTTPVIHRPLHNVIRPENGSPVATNVVLVFVFIFILAVLVDIRFWTP